MDIDDSLEFGDATLNEELSSTNLVAIYEEPTDIFEELDDECELINDFSDEENEDPLVELVRNDDFEAFCEIIDSGTCEIDALERIMSLFADKPTYINYILSHCGVDLLNATIKNSNREKVYDFLNNGILPNNLSLIYAVTNDDETLVKKLLMFECVDPNAHKHNALLIAEQNKDGEIIQSIMRCPRFCFTKLSPGEQCRFGHYVADPNAAYLVISTEDILRIIGSYTLTPIAINKSILTITDHPSLWYARCFRYGLITDTTVSYEENYHDRTNILKNMFIRNMRTTMTQELEQWITSGRAENDILTFMFQLSEYRWANLNKLLEYANTHKCTNVIKVLTDRGAKSRPVTDEKPKNAKKHIKLQNTYQSVPSDSRVTELLNTIANTDEETADGLIEQNIDILRSSPSFLQYLIEAISIRSRLLIKYLPCIEKIGDQSERLYKLCIINDASDVLEIAFKHPDFRISNLDDKLIEATGLDYIPLIDLIYDYAKQKAASEPVSNDARVMHLLSCIENADEDSIDRIIHDNIFMLKSPRLLLSLIDSIPTRPRLLIKYLPRFERIGTLSERLYMLSIHNKAFDVLKAAFEHPDFQIINIREKLAEAEKLEYLPLIEWLQDYAGSNKPQNPVEIKNLVRKIINANLADQDHLLDMHIHKLTRNDDLIRRLIENIPTRAHILTKYLHQFKTLGGMSERLYYLCVKHDEYHLLRCALKHPGFSIVGPETLLKEAQFKNNTILTALLKEYINPTS